MPDGQVRVVARFAVQPDRADEFIEAARRTMVEPTRKEPGCIEYDLCQDLSEPGRFVMVETWESEEALAVHLGLESLQAAVAALMPLAAEPPTVQRLVSVSSAS